MREMLAGVECLLRWCRSWLEIHSVRCAGEREGLPKRLQLCQYACVPSAKEKAMSSGVQCTDECVTKFNELKLKVLHLIFFHLHTLFLKLTYLLQHTCRFLIYKINDKNTEIGLETTGEKDATYAHFLTLLPENDCRYCVYDFE